MVFQRDLWPLAALTAKGPDIDLPVLKVTAFRDKVRSPFEPLQDPEMALGGLMLVLSWVFMYCDRIIS